MNVAILAFNKWNAGSFPNGPAICLDSFLDTFRWSDYNFEVISFLHKPSKEETLRKIRNSDIVHHWSGISSFNDELKFAAKCNIPIIFGPNLFDGVEKEKERKLLELPHSKILTVNKQIAKSLVSIHGIKESKVTEFIIGPKKLLWQPLEKRDDTILWKGNPAHKVKNYQLALAVAEKLKHLKFKFITNYNYQQHIQEAKRSLLYFTTSDSETMSMTLAESWLSELPSVTNSNIGLASLNEDCSVVADKTVASYAEKIEHLFYNKSLQNDLKEKARLAAFTTFSEENLKKKYEDIIWEAMN